MKYLFGFVLAIVLVIIVWSNGYGTGYKVGQLDNLPSQSEIQRIIGVKVDGVVGPESRRVWDVTVEQRLCNEAAMPIMEKFQKDFDRVCLNGMKFD